MNEHTCFYIYLIIIWMDWDIDTMDLAQEPILESVQEYQDWRLF